MCSHSSDPGTPKLRHADNFLESSANSRIAFFSESVLPWVDGVSRTLGQLFDALQLRNRAFRIYSPIPPSREYAWSANVRHVRSVAFPFHREYRVSMPDKRWLRADLDEFEPDLIHVCSPTPAPIWAQSYARSRGIPVAGSFHTDFAGYMRYYHLGRLTGLGWRGLRWFYNRCDATFAPSPSFVDLLQRRGVRNIKLWARGIDCERFSPFHRDATLRAQLQVDDECPLLLMVSRLVKEKDLEDLIQMDQALKRKGLRFEFALVGDGALRPLLQRGLPDAHFTGELTGPELSRWYASADIFVFPSTTETFGNVVQEAMASGLATVVVDKGGPSGLLQNGVSGLVARSNQPEDLAEHVASLIQSPPLRKEMGARARKEACTRTWEAVIDGLLHDYESMIAEKSLSIGSSR
jgi:phosphatidylinositol alpha 1,6-mannosyltransferase